MGFLKALVQFIKDVSQDPRIPAQDKAIFAALVALIVSPVDLIPDWIPVLGMLDDAVMIALILDYIFNVLEEEVILTHYPWTMKSFVRIRRGAKWIALLTPSVIRDRIWKYKPSPYRNG